MSSSTIIQVRDFSKEYQMGEITVHALRQVSFDIAAGEFVALMGASGSGKSTLMHLLGCLDSPTAGTYMLEGQAVSGLTKKQRAEIRNRRIGFIFQTFNLLPRLSALDNVMVPLLYGKFKDAKTRSLAALERVGLAERSQHKPTELSGGQRQRVAIARALVTDPAIILADEPTGNLDSKTGQTIMQLLLALNAEKDGDGNGRTIILVTHDAQVAAHTQRVLHMKDGEIVA
jgi:putative ABC transport system ATP-binding protein